MRWPQYRSWNEEKGGVSRKKATEQGRRDSAGDSRTIQRGDLISASGAQDILCAKRNGGFRMVWVVDDIGMLTAI